jgi:hypothetical protein
MNAGNLARVMEILSQGLASYQHVAFVAAPRDRAALLLPAQGLRS